MKLYLTVLSAALFTFACIAESSAGTGKLTDNDISTSCTMPASEATALFKDIKTPVASYKVYSSGESPESDPAGWILTGSNNGKKWKEIDRRGNISFCSRFQEKSFVLSAPANYKEYRLELLPASGGQGNIAVSEVIFSENNPDDGWESFTCPEVNFTDEAPAGDGSRYYAQLVQNVGEYVGFHCRKVAELLFFSPEEQTHEVRKINYVLRDFEGVAYKGGSPDAISVTFSTRHIEKSAKESLYKLDFETRGVLYHELTHAYQYEPRGCGNYGNNKVFWSCIEGVADAVRAQAGHFDMVTRRPGGNWLDGYRTTGFFIQWMTLEDPDAIRKFHATVRDLDVWSWDAAVKSLYGEQATIESKWDEYQAWLETPDAKII